MTIGWGFRVGAFFLLASTAAIGACAKGAEGDAYVEYLAAAPDEPDGDGDVESIKIPAASNPSSPDVVDAGGDAGKKADAGPGIGADAAADGGGTCTGSKSCDGATNLGSVSGDVGADVKSAQGHTSQWFTVRVTENDQALLGRALWMTATLVSAPGTNFDLYLYRPAADVQECSAVSSQSTNASGTDTAAVKFGETTIFATNVLDDRTVTLEVRHVSGPCDPSKKWKLEIAGNK